MAIGKMFTPSGVEGSKKAQILIDSLIDVS